MTSWRAAPVTGLPRRRDGEVDLLAVARAVDDPVLLETAGTAGWHYLALRTIGRVVDRGERTVLRDAGGEHDLGTDPFTAVEGLCERFGLTPDNRDRQPLDPAAVEAPAFTGGLVGAWSYDLARRIEPVGTVAVDDRAHAHLDLRLVDTVLACPPDAGPALVLHRDLGGTPLAIDAVADELVQRVASAVVPAHPSIASGTATATLDRAAHAAAVRRVLEHIAAGDTFQVNVTSRLGASWGADVWALYDALHAQSPAAYGAVFPDLVDGSSVASISPETFLGAIGRDVTIRPIKGTRPRHDDPDRDAEVGAELVASPKDRAENVMVVDMERNDLGRVCEAGTVRVPSLLDLEPHPTVWHLVSTVTGTLRHGVGWGELMRATFPCGSITGTPKVRAMQVIEALEPVRRGWYCGALGFLSAGAMSTSVSIRTAVLNGGGQVDYGAGGGIVADSDPDREWDELLHKAAAFLRAVGADAPS